MYVETQFSAVVEWNFEVEGEKKAIALNSLRKLIYIFFDSVDF